MSYRIFTTSEKAWKGMIADIDAARRSVYLQMYIVEDDSRGHEFLRAVREASLRGVRAVMILDTVGSFDLGRAYIEDMRQAGVEVMFSSSFFQRMHRKVLVIDEKSAFIGGVNVGRKYARWKDLQVRVTGPVVSTILRSFNRIYRESGGKDDLIDSTSDPSALRRAELWFVDHGIGKRRHLFRKYYEGRLRKAEKSIVFVTPYLFPPRWFIARLHQAMLRGVIVEVLLPESTDHTFVNGLNRSYAQCLASLGAKVYFMKGMNHAKGMVVDGTEGIIGSQNLDLLSFHMNIEAGVFFHEPDMVSELSEILEVWKKEAMPFDAVASARFHWYDYPLASFLRLFGFLPIK